MVKKFKPEMGWTFFAFRNVNELEYMWFLYDEKTIIVCLIAEKVS